MVPILTAAIVLSIKKLLLSKDMEGINEVFLSFLHLDQAKNKDLLPEPEVLIKLSMKMAYTPK